MRVVCDIETNSLDNPTRVWCVCAIDIDTKKEYVFDLTKPEELLSLRRWADGVSCWVGHNFIAYDSVWLTRLLDIRLSKGDVIDTLVLSHLLKYRLDEGHSLEAWGDRLGIKKVGLDLDFSDPSQVRSIIDRCKQDVKINLVLYEYLMKKLDRPEFHEAIDTEMQFAWVCREMHESGFCFDIDGAKELYNEIEKEVKELDDQIKAAFPLKPKLVKEYTPRLTKHGTISRNSVPRAWTDLSDLSPGASFSLIEWVEFNPTSTKQIIERISPFWDPVDRTDGYLKAQKERDREKLKRLADVAWKINEENLSTLNDQAPEAAKLLVRRLMLGARLRTLTEWLENCQLHIQIDLQKSNEDIIESILKNINRSKKSGENVTPTTPVSMVKNIERDLRQDKPSVIETISDDTALLLSRLRVCLLSKVVSARSARKNESSSSTITITPTELEVFYAIGVTSITNGTCRIHSTFRPIGTWTHRLSSQRPNAQNIAAEKSIKYNSPELKKRATELGGRMRSLWMAAQGALLVGTDMESAHLRIFAHLINDDNFKEALLKGDKKLGTDPHSVNARLLRDIGADRDRAKTFIFTFLNGGGVGKVTQIFGTVASRAKEALSRFIESYPGLKRFKNQDAKAWAKRGYFVGPDGRFVVNDSDHHMLAGYLQNYEATMMKKANLLWRKALDARGIKYKQVNLVHDEFVTEVYTSPERAWLVGLTQAASIRLVGKRYGMRCPMGGDWKVGKTWLEVH